MLVFQGSSETEARVMVIDSGYVGTAQRFKSKLPGLTGQYGGPVWMLLTHIDRDHIGGYRYLFQNPGFQEYGRIAGFFTTQWPPFKSWSLGSHRNWSTVLWDRVLV